MVNNEVELPSSVATDYVELGRRLGELVTQKQAAYGDAFGRSGNVMRVLYPSGVSPEQLDDALVVVRIIDKLFRVANAPGAFGEDPGLDIAGYGLLLAARNASKPNKGEVP